jgi:hypothetical protein
MQNQENLFQQCDHDPIMRALRTPCFQQGEQARARSREKDMTMSMIQGQDPFIHLLLPMRIFGLLSQSPKTKTFLVIKTKALPRT